MTAGCARAGVVSMRSPKGTPPAVMVPASVAPPLEAVPMNERLEYAIHWWGLPVGYAVLATSLPEEKGHEGLIRLHFEARSNWYLKALYPVRAELASYVDPATRSPRRAWSYLKRYWRLHESTLTFNRQTGICLHELPDDRKVEVPVTPTTQDGLSMIYYVRTMPLELGKTIPLTITADGKNWDLKAQVVRASMVRIGSLGDWPAVEGRLELAYPVPFFHGANARVWLSADNQRVPLMAKIRSRIGPVTVVLVRRRAGD
ncbi:MAG: DUF3108 domain-containing protein [Candidatus Omnitrophica bacterium]|nr:DUF3108 domain-containing protein [Candidatus Omnitrophota bacterium]